MYTLISDVLAKIKNENPLILNITNHVTLDFIANGLLSIGASPIMSFSEVEIDELTQLSSAIVINLGTLNAQFNQLCQQACKSANQHGKTIILDPVGAGASLYRTEISHSLLKNYRISVVRANAGEIMALTGLHSKTKGVDSQVRSEDCIKLATMLASDYDLTVCMSGKVDVIVNRNERIEYERGSPFMPMVTGSGCLLSAIVAAFNAVHSNPFEATKAASLFYAICGELAEKKSSGPASFKLNFLDNLSHKPEKKYYEYYVECQV